MAPRPWAHSVSSHHRPLSQLAHLLELMSPHGRIILTESPKFVVTLGVRSMGLSKYVLVRGHHYGICILTAPKFLHALPIRPSLPQPLVTLTSLLSP